MEYADIQRAKQHQLDIKKEIKDSCIKPISFEIFKKTEKEKNELKQAKRLWKSTCQ